MQVSVPCATVLRSGCWLLDAAYRAVTASPAAATSLGAVKSAAVLCLAPGSETHR